MCLYWEKLKNRCWGNSKGILHQVAFVFFFLFWTIYFLQCVCVYILLPVPPQHIYVLLCVYLHMFSHTRIRVSECVVMFSAAWHYKSAERPTLQYWKRLYCTLWVMTLFTCFLPLIFPCFTFTHSIKDEPCCHHFPALMIPCLPYVWLHVYITQLHSWNFLIRQEYICH